MNDLEKARKTLHDALQSAAFLIEQDPELKKADTLDLVEHDINAARVSLEALLDARALAEDETKLAKDASSFEYPK